MASLFSSFSRARKLVAEIQTQRPATPSGTVQLDSCGSLTCVRIGKHSHGPVCDFNCGCEKGQAVDAEQRS